MDVSNKYKFILPTTDGYINLPIELKWDFYGRDDSIEIYQEEVVKDIIGLSEDFEILRFGHDKYSFSENTKINYEFNFYSGNPNNVETSTPANWVCSYLPEGFTASEVYYYEKPFTKSFFKLDFYDSNSGTNQTNYFTVILPVQQGSTESVSISPTKPNVNIKKPSQFLDYVGDKEGFFFYWLRKKEFIDISTFYMTAKFFDARLGVFVKMMTVPQSTLPDVFLFNGEDKFYYKVVLDSVNQTYKIFNISNGLRVGEGTPIKWYEYINP
jgi:hypothetical protein